MATYVLVSGAWHAGWCWERVVPLLEAQGHRVVAPDLVGMGPDHAAIASASLATWANQIAADIRQQDEPVVLVGHSRGGIVISEAAERVPERVAILVYLAAYLVEADETLLTTAAKVTREQDASILVVHNDGTATIRRDAIRPVFYNTTEPFWVERAESLLTPEPLAVLSTPVEITDARYGLIPRAYIECSQDNAVPLALQRLMQQALPCAPVFTLETDHSPFYSAPEQLVGCLHQIGHRGE